VRSEARSTVDHLTHVLGIKEKSTRKSDDDMKKLPTTKTDGKSSNDIEKKKDTEKTIEQESTVKIVEGKHKPLT
jgi:transcription antitermination factor NusG